MTQPTFAKPKGTPPVLQNVAPDQLGIDRTYQRELDQRSHALINHIARNWDWNLFQPLMVARRADNSFFVVDGQHRLEAARRRGDIAYMPAVVFTPVDAADEAAMFVELNQQRRPLTAFALYNAAIAAGDEIAHALAGIMRDAGLSFTGASDPNKMKPATLNNVQTVQRWHARNGDRLTRVVLDAIGTAFPGQVIRIAGTLFMAVGAVVLQHGDRLSKHLLVDVLARTQDEWLADFRRRAATDGVGLQAAAIASIRDAYGEALAEIEADDAPAMEQAA
jgi:hypothetical protein